VVGKVCTQKFEGVNVQECLKSASVSLGVSEEKIKYLILEEKKGLFKKHAIISIDVIEDLDNKYILKEDFTKTDAPEKDDHNELNGTIEIRKGKFIIENPREGGKPAVIFTTKNVTLTVNEEKVSLSATVYAESIN